MIPFENIERITSAIEELGGTFARLADALEERNVIERQRLEIQQASHKAAIDRAAPGGDVLHFGSVINIGYDADPQAEEILRNADVPSSS